ncbi:CotH kinase family protein [Nocardiopsis sp. LOL_012]|uniref:CotH kinase family protein n=1 Tax=Nocardiopsis sp. LOL_012 TaxID=3345409 RepID=UPI003A869E6A
MADRTPTEPTPPHRRLRHRIPVRLRHHWKPLAAVCVGLLALLLVFGEARVRPYITSELSSAVTVTQDIEGTGDLFDGGGHSIEVSFNEDEYAEMMATFREEGEKKFIQADITIDGTLVTDVGLRLKGNSTLRSLSGGGTSQDGGEGGGAMPQMPEGMAEGEVPRMPGNATENTGDTAANAAGDQAAAGAPQGGGMGGTVSLSEEEPERLPWLISFDEFVAGRAYQGHTELALRPATSVSDTALNEALALDLTAASGQTAQEYTFTSVAVNGGEAVPRLLIDHPDALWSEELGEGVLYKGRAGGSFSYLGDDPTDYEEAFKQVNAEGAQDLQPVMDLLRFVVEADDEEFADELDAYLDTESFAAYLATQDLISNGDAMDGPGNNYYLWYDTGQERFTVLSWDLNLAFGGMGGAMAGGGPGAFGDQATGEGQETGEADAAEGMGMPGGTQPSGGMEPPGGMGAPQGTGTDQDGAAAEDTGGDRGGRGGSGALKERFLADEDFTALYEQAYADLHASLVADGTASDLLESAVDRAARAGDDGAEAAGTSLAEQVAAVAETPQRDGGSAMPGAVGNAPEGTG